MAVVAGVAGIYASYHLDVAAGGAVALALCAAAARRRRCYPRAAVAEPRAREGARYADRARRDHRQADELRQREAQRDVVVAAHELDEAALRPGEDEAEREQAAGREPVAQPPEQRARERPSASVS